MCSITVKQNTILYIGFWVNFIKECYAVFPVTLVTALINRVNIIFVSLFNVVACFNLMTIFVRRIFKTTRLAWNDVGFHNAKYESQSQWRSCILSQRHCTNRWRTLLYVLTFESLMSKIFEKFVILNRVIHFAFFAIKNVYIPLFILFYAALKLIIYVLDIKIEIGATGRIRIYQ